ncbi:MAG TPA: dihydrofolate reductase family protein [Daejeonella sp.]|nr:dihydrofolate reductase family protein [Daejeonella sp.]
MRKIILDLAVTLDGFIEGPNGEIDWCILEEDPGLDSAFADFLSGIDAIFYGRVSYELWGNYQPDEKAGGAMQELFDSIHRKSKYVFSKTKQGDDGKAAFISSDIRERVQEIRQQPGKDIWLYGGAKLITTFVNLGLVDVFRLAVHPVILGGGKPLFNDIKSRVNLKLIDAKGSVSGVALLIYERVDDNLGKS